MHAVNLLPPKGGLSGEAADEWIEALLREHRLLEQFNDQFLPLSDEPDAMSRAHQLRDQWHQWAQDAQVLLEKVEGRADVDLAKLRDLRIHQQGAMLRARNDPEEMKRRFDETKDVPGRSIEEWRRELGLKPRR